MHPVNFRDLTHLIDATSLRMATYGASEGVLIDIPTTPEEALVSTAAAWTLNAAVLLHSHDATDDQRTQLSLDAGTTIRVLPALALTNRPRRPRMTALTVTTAARAAFSSGDLQCPRTLGSSLHNHMTLTTPHPLLSTAQPSKESAQT